MVFYGAILLVSSLTAVKAVNDWSVPCFKGECEYSLPAGSSSGSLKIWGGADAITDITTAAGWEIIGCSPDETSQDIRLVCKDDDTATGCDHLYQNVGAEGKVVRLPESCGKNAFARISKAWVPKDQSIPSDIARRIVRRDGAQPEVKALSLDTNFDQIDSSKLGAVNIAILGANVPGVPDGIDIPTNKVRSRHFHRGLFDFVGDAAKKVGDVASDAVGAATNAVDDAKNAVVDAGTAAVGAVGDAVDSGVDAVGDAADKVVDVAKDGADKVVDGAEKVVDEAKDGAKKVVDGAKDAADAVGDAAGDVVDAAKDLNNVSANKNINLDPIDVNKQFNLLDTTLNCPPITAKVKIDVNAKAHATAALGVAASGTLVPPKLDDFKVTATMSADIDSSAQIFASVAGTLDSGKIKIFEVGVPGLDFPGILSIGPTFNVDAQAKASLELSVNMTVGFKYTIDKAELEFPPSDKKAGAFNIQDTPLDLSVSPDVKATGKLEIHLIPSLNLGISAFADKAKATVFLNLDASAIATLTLEAKLPDIKTQVGRSIEGRAPLALPAPPEQTLVPAPIPPKDDEETDDSDSTDDSKSAESTDASETSSASKSDKTDSADDSSATSSANDKTDDASATSSAEDKASTAKADDSASDSAADKATSTAEKESSSEAADKTATASSSTASASSTAAGNDKVELGGCFDVTAGFSVNAGADATFFTFFGTGTKVVLFEKKFELFKKCFGANNKRAILGLLESSRLEREALERRMSWLEGRAPPLKINCPAKNATAASPVSVASGDVKPK